GCTGALAAASKGKRSKGADRRMVLTFAMIGMVRKDRCGAEELLRQHGADQQVRPGRCAKGDQDVGTPPLLFAMAVSGADQKARLALACVAPGFEHFRQIVRR